MLLLCQLCVSFLVVQGSPNFPVTNAIFFFAKNLSCQMAIFYNIESFPSCQLYSKSECCNYLLTYVCRITLATQVQLSCYHITLYVPVNLNYHSSVQVQLPNQNMVSRVRSNHLLATLYMTNVCLCLNRQVKMSLAANKHFLRQPLEAEVNSQLN